MDSNNCGTIRTHSNILYHVLEPVMSEVNIEDIAHGLSNLCRFSGQCYEFYSVAQHSLYVSYALEQFNYPKSVVLYGLLHDASEAYCCDLPRPIKHSGQLGAYQVIEFKNERVIEAHFDLNLTQQQKVWVKEIDKRVCATEQRDLFRVFRDDTWVREFRPFKWRIKAVSPKVAESLFLLRYRQLTDQLSFVDKLRIIGDKLIRQIL